MAGHYGRGHRPRPPPADWARSRSRSKTRCVDHAEGVQPVQRWAHAHQGEAEGVAAVAAAKAEAAPSLIRYDDEQLVPVPPQRQAANLFSFVRAVFWLLMSMGFDVDCSDIADRPRGGPRRTAAALRCACYRHPLIRPAPHRPRLRGCSRSKLRLARPPHRRLLTRRTTRHLAPCTPRRRLRSLADDDGHAGALAAGPAKLGHGIHIANEAYYHQYLSSQRHCRCLW